MATLDDIFKREFNQTRNNLKGRVSIFDLGLKPTALPKQDLYTVKGIELEHYSNLNDTNVMLVPRGVELKQRLMKAKGEKGFRTDREGNVRTVTVAVPKGSVAVISTKAIGVPYSFRSDGFSYVDYMEVGKSRKYIYIIPSIYLYKVNLNALALSTKKMKAYSGVSVKTWNLGILNICVIPYKPNRSYENTVILTVKQGLDFTKEVNSLIGSLVKLGVISDPLDYITDEGVNLAINDIDPAYNVMEYDSVGVVSLADSSNKTIEEVLNG